ncbi:MAG TPA: ankyrin repeat domain-containing protein, partial [Candidatus Acidoferrum sp.]|nr:ankyrin repeat domain-containing protein [Candidatus Acidoferrum sp.]
MPDTQNMERLFEACGNLDVAGVRTAIARGVDLECRNVEDNTPLLCVIDVVSWNPPAAIEIARLLLAAGADIEA